MTRWPPHVLLLGAPNIVTFNAMVESLRQQSYQVLPRLKRGGHYRADILKECVDVVAVFPQWTRSPLARAIVATAWGIKTPVVYASALAIGLPSSAVAAQVER